MKKRTMLISCISILLLSMLVSGMGKLGVTLDTEKNKMYVHYQLADLLRNNVGMTYDEMKKMYDNKCIAVWGEIESISANKKTIVLKGINSEQSKRIECKTSDKELINCIEKFKLGDYVKVCGKASVFITRNIEIQIEDVTECENNITANGEEQFKTGQSYTNNEHFDIGGELIDIYVPATWVDVKHNIIEEELGEIDGLQFRLNEISGEEAIDSECFFICYLDEKLLNNKSDISRTDAVEKSIVANIIPNEKANALKANYKKQKTYYGEEYHYYWDTYKDSKGQKHRYEFVFKKAKKGIILFLYVYKNETNHLEDILYVMKNITEK